MDTARYYKEMKWRNGESIIYLHFSLLGIESLLELCINTL